MKINEIFAKPIDRDIKGVVKVGQITDDIRKQELEEYVVTKELQKHFASFFDAYQKSITGYTDNMGVWIDGFFGSGKSHFLKILSYLLKNEKIAGKPAVDYFKDDNKIDDSFVMSQIENAAQVPTDVILFNIDSKAGSNAGSDKNAILRVFLNVFNEMQGYSTVDPYIADLERGLADAGLFDSFKTKFQELTRNEGREMTWEKGASHYKFKKQTIKQALVEVGYMTEGNAQGYMDSLSAPYQITIEQFASRVNDYIQKMNDNRHVVFLVDEVGQFIGSDVNRMLNLQTIVEELGAQTRGKAWVIVTSQQAIDEVVDGNINGQDFSKIQGRFKTRISMSSANVDEVIKKRILSKNAQGNRRLEEMYDDEQHNINNKIDFQEGIQRQKFDSAASFAENYPFVPYQFHLLQDSLNAIRLHGSDGKHLSEGERSMLATFQEAAERYKDEEIRSLIPFSLFFEGLAQFLDHNHKLVIERAENDEYVNPKHEQNPFAIQVLKTLFMVKYVDNFKSTPYNLTTLLLTSIDEDRQELENKLMDALKVLEKQDYILKNVDTYEFLTDAEQDINNEIKHEEVTDADISKSIGEDFIFQEKAVSNKFTYPRLKGRYVFGFNRYIDEIPVGATNNELSIRLYTPIDTDYNQEEAQLKRISTNPEMPSVIIDMPAIDDYVVYLKRSAQIAKYLRRTHNDADKRQQQIIANKSEERKQLNESAKTMIQTALENSDVYVNGEKLDENKDFSNTLAQAQQMLVDDVYRKLPYITAAKSEKDIIDLFKANNELVDENDNEQAIKEVIDKIARRVGSTGKVSMRTIMNDFSKIPYHYTEEDIEWLIAKLFADGNIRAEINGEKFTISNAQENARIAASYFTKKQYQDKLTFQPKKTVSPRQMKDARDFAKDILNRDAGISDETSEEKIVEFLSDEVEQKIQQLEKYASNSRMPGNIYLQNGIELFKDIKYAIANETFYEVIGKKLDDFYDWLEDIEERGIKEFYSDQLKQDYWNASLRDIEKFKSVSSLLIEDGEISQIIQQEEKLIREDNPKDTIPELHKLHDKFAEKLNDLIDRAWDEYKGNSDKKRQEVLDYLGSADFNDTVYNELYAEIQRRFNDKDSSVKNDSEYGNLSNIFLGKNAIDNISTNLMDKITAKTQKAVDAEVRRKNDENSNIDGDDQKDPSETNEPSADKGHNQIKLNSVDWKDVLNDGVNSVSSNAEIDKLVKNIGDKLKEKLKGSDKLNIRF